MNALRRTSEPGVLVVDDDWAVAVTVQRVLCAAGYRVQEIVTAAKAVPAAFDRVRPDLLLLDIALGAGADGIEVAERLRLRTSVPIVFLSAHCDAHTLRRAMRVAPRGFVVKPFSDAQLATAVELALAPPEATATPSPSAERTLAQIAALLTESGHSLPEPIASEPADVSAAALLSKREREVLCRLLKHERAPGIARQLGISEHTVRNHLKSMYGKMGVHSQEELLALVTGRRRSSR